MVIFLFLIIAGLGVMLFLRGRRLADASLKWSGKGILYACALVMAALSRSPWLFMLVGFVGGGMLLMDWWRERVSRDNFGMGSLEEGAVDDEASTMPFTPSASGKMSHAEAISVLGLEEPFTDNQVDAAWKKLMQQLHPDKGGTDWMAAKLNEARDRLKQS